MSLASNFLIAVGLSADAFAVSVARSATIPTITLPAAIRTGLVFGTVEGCMVLLGWLLGSSFAGLIAGLDHWIALLLLGAVGGHMIYEGLHDDDAPGTQTFDIPSSPAPSRRWKTLLAAIGTSIDGAAIGVTFAFINVNVWAAVPLIAGVSFCISTVGALIGPRVGALIGRRAEILGGIVLIGIGISIFFSHMGEAPPG